MLKTSLIVLMLSAGSLYAASADQENWALHMTNQMGTKGYVEEAAAFIAACSSVPEAHRSWVEGVVTQEHYCRSHDRAAILYRGSPLKWSRTLKKDFENMLTRLGVLSLEEQPLIEDMLKRYMVLGYVEPLEGYYGSYGPRPLHPRAIGLLCDAIIMSREADKTHVCQALNDWVVDLRPHVNYIDTDELIVTLWPYVKAQPSQERATGVKDYVLRDLKSIDHFPDDFVLTSLRDLEELFSDAIAALRRA